MRHLWLGTTFLVAACGPGLRGTVSFEGRRAPVTTTAAGLVEASVLPASHERIGSVRAGCTLTEPFSRVEGAWLSDVDCRASRLRQSLRERAAAVGGELLVRLECRSEPRGAAHNVERRWLSCAAEVARSRRGGSRVDTPSSGAGDRWPGTASAVEAWSIRVDFTPADGIEARPARHPDSVRERAEIPPSHVRLGGIVTQCEEGCSERGGFEGLLATAARAGASDVAEVACTARGSGWVCTGSAIGHRVDPVEDPAAR
ncbi:MAG: hypothetical protein JW751_14210 [Polyangiaceae bacterium]|nr:hypothetical protein [Polyangiaceae bacterium]